MNNQDARWLQRFKNYQKALAALSRVMKLTSERDLNEAERQGLIKAFEFTFELAWNVMKDYLEYMGITGIVGSKGAVRLAFQNGLIADGQVWIDMIDDRSLSSHSYDEATADKLNQRIKDVYYSCFDTFAGKMERVAAEDAAHGKF
ncbi:MAG: nucleotidyltransferase substrate binding protein [Dysgonamonadaceae bacterium]|jgi:nucleotidyltransferase substrate binding protein (TIGR01987 family)|nr:nucleotidyltransferase substrate binding protein [Dysgonamonadaceae bacterium]